MQRRNPGEKARSGAHPRHRRRANVLAIAFATAAVALIVVWGFVVAPKAEEVATPEAAAGTPAAAAEPEVIKKGKKDEDEGDAKAEKKDKK